MSCILVLKEANLREDLENLMSGMDLYAYPGLRRHFKTECKEFELPDGVLDLLEVCEPVVGCGTPCSPQSITLTEDMSDSVGRGNWGIMRVIRRKAPWNTAKIPNTISSFFDCVRDGSGVDIYVLDTGIRTTHEQFGSRASMIYEYDDISSEEDPHGHGTSIASAAAGVECGIARGATVFGCRISSGTGGDATNSGLIGGIGAMITNHGGRTAPAVCNVSYAFTSTAVSSAINDAVDAGIIFAGAAGNEAVNLDSANAFPGEADDCVCVGAISMVDVPTWFARDDGTISATGYGITAIDIMAPGQFFWLADKDADDDYIRLAASTSAATGITTGVLACMLQGHSKLTSRAQVQAVKAKLLANATTGRLRIPANWHTPIGSLPDRILYLDPLISAPEDIPGIS